MDETTAKQRIAELKQLLERYNEEYYVQDAPTVTDYEYDMLMRELRPWKGNIRSLQQQILPPGTLAAQHPEHLKRYLMQYR
ncbi:MAG: hypothetical protein ACLT3Y_07820 [Ruminococcus callidus]